ncbi:MAG TPA: hypothetical protein VFB80_10875 [Pirellulaceae bacterium]|nr:hypothetical protein [Pirellulaceae bacterium]
MTKETKYSVRCSCGRTTPVEKSSAGGEVACQCGQRVPVPRLSELRRRAGESAFVQGTVDAIHEQIREGKLPAGDLCAFSLRPTSDVLWITVECETPYRKGGQSWAGMFFLGLAAVFCGWLSLLYLFSRREPDEMMGREVVLRLPLRIAADAQPEVRRLGTAKLRELLSMVPIYAQLLGEYPQARIHGRQ